ncbi:MAG: hypothetical protein LWX02_09620 [Deltaproteobacteria bacterium]|jgi:hypothetical protein|nr:hypothetical protein [Deltaproteobacteria bacterium]
MVIAKKTHQQEQKENEIFDRMIARLDRSIAACKRISSGLDVLMEAHQPGSEHFLHEHSKVD